MLIDPLREKLSR